ncbi:MAG: PKD domain-containing protein [Desulfobacteria bacterium]
MRHNRCRRFGSVVVLGLLLLPAVAVFAADMVTVPLFPGEVFYRDTGAPFAVTRTFTVPATEGTFVLRLVNGDGATDNLVSSAVVRVNGAALVSGKDLNQHVYTLERPVTNLVKGQNTLEVEVRSVPSSYITVTIEGTYLLGVHITDPAPSASLASDRVTVRGTYVGYTGDVGITVNGIRAAISGNTFVAEDVPLAPEGNTLSAVVTSFDGIWNADSITVASLGVKPPLALWSNFSSGVPPFSVSFRPEVEGIAPVDYRYDFDGDGSVDNAVATEEAVSFAYTAPGTYRATVAATDAAGQTYMAEKTIVVQERQAVDTLLSGRWHGLSLSLEAQDLQGGLAHLLPESRAKYQAIFSPLAAQLPTVFASISLPELIRVTGNVAQYRVRREQMWQGAVRTITYYVWFVKDQDGVWRIDAF